MGAHVRRSKRRKLHGVLLRQRAVAGLHATGSVVAQALNFQAPPTLLSESAWAPSAVWTAANPVLTGNNRKWPAIGPDGTWA